MYYATINITLYLNNIYSFESYKNIVNGWYLQEALSIKNEILMWRFFDYKKIINSDFVCLFKLVFILHFVFIDYSQCSYFKF